MTVPLTSCTPQRSRGSEPSHVSVFWYGLTGDFEVGLDFLLDVMGGGDYSDTDTIIQVLEKYLPDYDQSKGTMPLPWPSACPKAI